MRDPKRIKRILGLLGEVWEKVPDWRFGQLIFNEIQGKYGYMDLFHLEDSILETFLTNILTDMESKSKSNG